jgi:hypothetical protein
MQNCGLKHLNCRYWKIRYIYRSKPCHLMKIAKSLLMICILIFSLTACKENKQAGETTTETDSSVIKKRRDDGTLSSMNPVDENGYLL